MATIRQKIMTSARPERVWDAIRDIGALHTRLVPGFVADTRLEPGARVVTFANGVTVREPIVTIDDEASRLVWTAESQRTTHYNGAVEVFDKDGMALVVWTADFLPDTAAADIGAMMEAGARAMKVALDQLGCARQAASGFALCACSAKASTGMQTCGPRNYRGMPGRQTARLSRGHKWPRDVRTFATARSTEWPSKDDSFSACCSVQTDGLYKRLMVL